MLVSDKFRFIYIDVPKTGSTTLDTVFKKYCSGRYINRTKTSKKHRRSIPEQYKSYKKLVSVRNPYTRILSHYYWNKKQNRLHLFNVSNFDEFLDFSVGLNKYNELENLQHDIAGWFSCARFLRPIGYDVVLKQESLETDLKQLRFIPEDIEVPKINKIKYPSWEELKTSERVEKVNLW